MPKLLISDAEYNVQVRGQGPAVTAIHGFTGELTTWGNFSMVASRYFTVVLVDVLGHGKSASPADPDRYGMERCVDDLLAILDRLGINHTAWVGYSMGGRIALGAAVTAPERSTALVLESASPGLATAEERAQRIKSDENLACLLETQGLAAFVELWETQSLFASQKKSMSDRARARLRAQRLRSNPQGLANSLRGIGTGAQPSFHVGLSQLRMPVLFVVGEEDSKFCGIAREMGSEVHQGRIEVIPNAGHTAHLEQPRHFNKVVMDFLKEHLLASEVSSTYGVVKTGGVATQPSFVNTHTQARLVRSRK